MSSSSSSFLLRRHVTTLHHHRRTFSTTANAVSILSPDSKAPFLTSKQKSRAALSLLKTEKNPEKILDIITAASLSPSSSRLDRISLSVAVSNLSSSKQLSTVKTLLESLKNDRPDLKNEAFLSHSVVLYGHAGMPEDAIRTFEEFPQMGIERSTKTLQALLFSCHVAKKPDLVKRVFIDFPKRYGLELDLDCYNVVIKSFCESGSSSSVYSILAEMDRKRIKPNGVSFGVLIAGFYQEEKYEEVGKVLDLMKKKYEMTPGVSIYNIRIKSLCKLRKSIEAKALLDGMISNGMKPNLVTYDHLIHGFCKEGRLEEAKGLFKKMVNSGFVPDSNCYFTIVHFMCSGGDFEYALMICKESMEKGWFPNFTTMKMLINGLANGGKVDEAKELLEKVKEKFPKHGDLWTVVEEGLPKSES